MKSIRAGKVVMLLVVFVILISSFGCSKKDNFNIVGTWAGVINIGITPLNITLVFTGSESSGSVQNTSGQNIGSYAVYEKNVDWGLQLYGNSEMGYIIYSFTGTANSDNNMSGTAIYYASNYPTNLLYGTWNFSR